MIGVLDPFAGHAGDMFLAALLQAGAPLGEVRASIAATGLPSWELHVEQIVDHGADPTIRSGAPGSERHVAPGA